MEKANRKAEKFILVQVKSKTTANSKKRDEKIKMLGDLEYRSSNN